MQLVEQKIQVQDLVTQFIRLLHQVRLQFKEMQNLVVRFSLLQEVVVLVATEVAAVVLVDLEK
jgi:hypothetical protein